MLSYTSDIPCLAKISYPVYWQCNILSEGKREIHEVETECLTVFHYFTIELNKANQENSIIVIGPLHFVITILLMSRGFSPRAYGLKVIFFTFILF